MEILFYILSMILLLMLIIYLITPSDKLFEFSLNLERSLAHLNLKTVSITEGEISYLESKNKNLPTLVLLHGFGANKDNWTRMSKYLSNKYHVIALDLPGFGESFKSPKLEYGILTQVARVNEFAKAIKMKKFHIAGNSMGGLIAANYAVTYPSEVKSLWLLNTLGVISAPLSEMAKMIKNNQPPILIAKNAKDFDELLGFLFHKKPFLPKFAKDVLAKEAISNAENNSKIFQELLTINTETSTINLEKILINFTKPLLVTWGDKDRVLHYKAAGILATIVPQAQINVMTDIGHLPMLEAPKQTANEFLEFDRINH